MRAAVVVVVVVVVVLVFFLFFLNGGIGVFFLFHSQRYAAFLGDL